MNTDFPRIKRLPPYVFNITGELKMAARRRGEDIIDLSMGNPDDRHRSISFSKTMIEELSSLPFGYPWLLRLTRDRSPAQGDLQLVSA